MIDYIKENVMYTNIITSIDADIQCKAPMLMYIFEPAPPFLSHEKQYACSLQAIDQPTQLFVIDSQCFHWEFVSKVAIMPESGDGYRGRCLKGRNPPFTFYECCLTDGFK